MRQSLAMLASSALVLVLALPGKDKYAGISNKNGAKPPRPVHRQLHFDKVCSKSIGLKGLRLNTMPTIAADFGACRDECGGKHECVEFGHDEELNACELRTSVVFAERSRAVDDDGRSAFRCTDYARIIELRRKLADADADADAAGAPPPPPINAWMGPLTTDNKIFAIGSGKTGTFTLRTIFAELDMKPCHNDCQDTKLETVGADFGMVWGEIRNKDSPQMQTHQAFTDNGGMVDVAWLVQNFPDARFILTVRPVFDWVVAKFHMIKLNRMRANCPPVGDVSNCGGDADTQAGILENGKPTEMIYNKLRDIGRLIVKAAADQEETLELFDRSPKERQNRFVMLDITEDPSNVTLKKLMWLVRRNTSEYPLYGVQKTWDSATNAHFMELGKQTGIHIMYNNSLDFDDESLRDVDEMLTTFGCQNFYEDVFLNRCADAVENWTKANPTHAPPTPPPGFVGTPNPPSIPPNPPYAPHYEQNAHHHTQGNPDNVDTAVVHDPGDMQEDLIYRTPSAHAPHSYSHDSHSHGQRLQREQTAARQTDVGLMEQQLKAALQAKEEAEAEMAALREQMQDRTNSRLDLDHMNYGDHMNALQPPAWSTRGGSPSDGASRPSSLVADEEGDSGSGDAS